MPDNVRAQINGKFALFSFFFLFLNFNSAGDARKSEISGLVALEGNLYRIHSWFGYTTFHYADNSQSLIATTSLEVTGGSS